VVLYRVERPLSGPVGEADIDAAAFRSAVCLRRMSGIRWVRSYLDRERWQMTCYYEAENADLIREHARQARIACASVTPVEEYLPEHYR
jgi:hypothetical protein